MVPSLVTEHEADTPTVAPAAPIPEAEATSDYLRWRSRSTRFDAKSTRLRKRVSHDKGSQTDLVKKVRMYLLVHRRLAPFGRRSFSRGGFLPEQLDRSIPPRGGRER